MATLLVGGGGGVTAGNHTPTIYFGAISYRESNNYY